MTWKYKCTSHIALTLYSVKYLVNTNFVPPLLACQLTQTHTHIKLTLVTSDKLTQVLRFFMRTLFVYVFMF